MAGNIKEFYKKVSEIQGKLKAPKGQKNNFGNYKYRSCEDILEAVKPLLTEHNLVLTVNDELVIVGENNSNTRFYIKAVSTITDGEFSISNSALAREPDEKKGMDVSQITGASSSYARKYSLNGLLLIDDTKDADSNEATEKSTVVTQPKAQTFTPSTPIVTTEPLSDNKAPIVAKKGWTAKPTTATPAVKKPGDMF